MAKDPRRRPAAEVVRCSTGGLSVEEVKHMMDEMYGRIRAEVMGELQKDIRALQQQVSESQRSLAAGLEKNLLEVQSLREECEALSSRLDAPVRQGSMSKFLGDSAWRICGRGTEVSEPSPRPFAKRRPLDEAAQSQAPPEDRAIIAPAPPAATPEGPAAAPVAADAAGFVPRGSAPARAPSLEQAVPAGAPGPCAARAQLYALSPAPAPAPAVRGLLGPTVQRFSAALKAGPNGAATGLDRGPFVEGLEAYAGVLDQLGGSMGSYLLTNTKKLRASKASPELTSYREWLLSELPVHKKNKYEGYVDDSAFMANLWIGWTMEFFVEMFALLHEGRETKASVDAAYKQTLAHHHNWFQQTAFGRAVTQLPDRQKMIGLLQGPSAQADVVRDIGDFVQCGRPIVKFCLQMNEEVSARMQEEKKAYASARSATSAW